MTQGEFERRCREIRERYRRGRRRDRRRATSPRRTVISVDRDVYERVCEVADARHISLGAAVRIMLDSSRGVP